MTTYAMHTLHLPAQTAMLIGAVSGGVIFFAALFDGWLSDIYGRRLLMAAPMFYVITNTENANLIFACIAVLALFQAMSGAVGIIALPEFFPRAVRTSGLSITYALGVTIFGGSAQLVVTWLLDVTGNPMALAWYLVLTSMITVYAIYKLKPPSRRGNSGMIDIKNILAELDTYIVELVAIRHDIHAHPELGFEEHRTANLVATKLRHWGLEVTENVGRTGVVGTLRGNIAGNRSVGLRADMDALALVEKTGLPYASTVPGKMHVCGHYGHTTMLLGAARYLSEHRDFAGTVHCIFQPAEEGLGGGREMVADGLFDRFPVDAVYGMHNNPGQPANEIVTRKGAYLAASDTWQVTFTGTGGHGGAAPHVATDPTMPAAHFILAVQSIIGRNVASSEQAVISVGHILAGDAGAPNIIPDTVTVKGTARSYNPDVRDLIERRLGELATHHAVAFDCSAQPIYTRRYPPMVNAAETTDKAVAAAIRVVGAENVDGDAPRQTGAEDFSFMLEARPGTMIMIGNGVNEDGTAHFVHTPHYDFNDAIIPTGIAYWVAIVAEELA